MACSSGTPSWPSCPRSTTPAGSRDYAYRLDQLFERHRHWLGPDIELGRRPSEYIGTNAYFTFQKDPVAVETRARVGVTQLMWASDYPHSDSTWPHSRKVIERDFEGVGDAELELLVAGNAARVYGF